MREAAELILAFDFGLRRIGVASANLLTRTASPLTTLTIDQAIPWSEVDGLIADWKPHLLVVGMPQGGPTSIATDVGRFIEALNERYGLNVESVDESLTSRAAAADIREKRRSGFLRRRAPKGSVDRHAACLIAEQWMNAAR